MVDTLETASAFGLIVRPKLAKSDQLERDASISIRTTAALARLIDAWLPLTFAANSLNRSMGQPDLYPFVLTPAVIVKLAFVHDSDPSERRREALRRHPAGDRRRFEAPGRITAIAAARSGGQPRIRCDCRRLPIS